MWQHFSDLRISHHEPTQGRGRYSVTGDILAFQQCPIQYGAFTARRYEPALVVQLFYGTVIHEVLDRAHAHFRGELEAEEGSLPSDRDIDGYFAEVENALISRKIRAVQKVRDQAREILKRFNRLEGPLLYPRIIDTECRLQADQQDYILHGNVDVLVGAEGDVDGVEIWDYKGGYKPSVSDPDFRRYLFQMQVYADLYRQKTGKRPTKAVLYFLNELAGEPPPEERPINALLEVTLREDALSEALESFGATVQEIERCKSMRTWPGPEVPPAKRTCNACDLRWNCSAARDFGREYPMMHP